MISEFRLKLYVTDHAIYTHYLGDFAYNTRMSSPFRKDANPSFVVYYKNGKIFWKDFGYMSDTPKDAIGLISEIYSTNRDQAINIIWKDIVLAKNTIIKNIHTERKKYSKNFYNIKIHDIKDFELKYWVDNFTVGIDYLRFFGVFGLESLYRKNDFIWESSPLNPAYVYTYKDKNIFKIYRPKDTTKDKFRGQNNGLILEGWEQLPKNADELIIQSSFKDTIVCRRAGYLGCNPTGEASLLTLLNKVHEINQRFKKVFVLFDNDKPGRHNSNLLCSKTGWTPLFMRSFKDPSDSVQYLGNYFDLYNSIGNKLSKKYHI